MLHSSALAVCFAHFNLLGASERAKRLFDILITFLEDIL